MSAAEKNDIGVYVHFPYCLQKCPYCDFNSHVPRRAGMYGQFVEAVGVELQTRLPEAGDRRLVSVYLGGGTPSLLPPEAVRSILQRIDDYFGPRRAPVVEVTLEANPGAVERTRLFEQRAAGINRVSMGVQALDDRWLRQLGRIHDTAEALAALELIRTAQFDTFSIDLIFAVPGQTRADWRAALERAINLETPHVSAYNLTYEPGTLMTAWRDRGQLRTVTEDIEVEMFDDTVQVFGEHGLHRYEVSNFARPHHESVHNRLYWQGLPYVGVGPGAHSFRFLKDGRGERKEGRRNPEVYATTWLQNQGCDGFEFTEQVDAFDMATERAMLGLRTVAGWDATATEVELQEGAVAAAQQVANDHPEWCQWVSGCLKPTPLGLRMTNSLVLSASHALDRFGKLGHSRLGKHEMLFGGRQRQ